VAEEAFACYIASRSFQDNLTFCIVKPCDNVQENNRWCGLHVCS